MAATTLAPATARIAVGKASISPSLWLFRTLHLWLGLSFGLLLVAQGLSGAALVWRPELDRLMLPALTQTAASRSTNAPFARIDEEFQAAQQAVPGATVRGVRLPEAGGGSEEWMVQMPSGAQPVAGRGGPRLTVYTSPATGRVLGIRGRQKDALQWLIELHHNLLLGAFGRSVQGVLAVATLCLALSGLWLWWPKSFTLSRFRPRAAARPLHYAIGFWAMWPLLAIATTALYFTWRQPIQHLFGIPGNRQGGAPEARKGAGSGDGGASGARHEQDPHGGRHVDTGAALTRAATMAEGVPASLAAVLTTAQATAPGARLTTLRLPEGHGPFVVMFEDKAEAYRDAPNSITLRATPAGGVQVVRRSLWRDLPANQRFLEWLPRVHQGEFGGVLIKTLWSMTGLMPAVLYLSGFLMWRRRLTADRRLQPS